MTKDKTAPVLVKPGRSEEPTQLLNREFSPATALIEYPSPIFKTAPLAGTGSFFTEAAGLLKEPRPSPPAQRPRELVTL